MVNQPFLLGGRGRLTSHDSSLSRDMKKPIHLQDRVQFTSHENQDPVIITKAGLHGSCNDGVVSFLARCEAFDLFWRRTVLLRKKTYCAEREATMNLAVGSWISARKYCLFWKLNEIGGLFLQLGICLSGIFRAASLVLKQTWIRLGDNKGIHDRIKYNLAPLPANHLYMVGISIGWFSANLYIENGTISIHESPNGGYLGVSGIRWFLLASWVFV